MESHKQLFEMLTEDLEHYLRDNENNKLVLTDIVSLLLILKSDHRRLRAEIKLKDLEEHG